MARYRHTVAIALLAGAMLPLSASAVPVQAQAEASSVPAEEEIEEIVVVAPRPVFRIRYEIVKADEALFDLFNELNDDHEFDVRCKWQTTEISRIKSHVCSPSFARRINENEWRRNGDEIFLSPALNVSRGDLRRKYRVFREKMIELAEGNPALQELVFERARLEREYIAARLDKKLRREP